MTDIDQETITRCHACSMCIVSPFTTCPRCAPATRAAEVQSFRDGAKQARAVEVDFYSEGLIAQTNDGFVLVRDAMRLMQYRVPDELKKSKDQLIADLTKTREENRDLLVENAKLRRALERKR